MVRAPCSALVGAAAAAALQCVCVCDGAGLSSLGRTLLWADEFSGSSLNTSTWSFASGTNASTVYVQGGNLVLKQPQGVVESRLTGLYGYIEMRAAWAPYDNAASGLSAFPKDQEYGAWPNSGSLDLGSYSSCYWYSVSGSIRTNVSNYIAGHTPWANSTLVSPYLIAPWEFHIYRFLWNATHLSWGIDDVFLASYANDGKGFTTWPFDKRFYLRLSLLATDSPCRPFLGEDPVNDGMCARPPARPGQLA